MYCAERCILCLADACWHPMDVDDASWGDDGFRAVPFHSSIETGRGQRGVIGFLRRSYLRAAL